MNEDLLTLKIKANSIIGAAPGIQFYFFIKSSGLDTIIIVRDELLRTTFPRKRRSLRSSDLMI